jgi:hypothetical protein
MGQMIKNNGQYEYQQKDGQTTAWFSNSREIRELAHKGSSFYRKIFYYLIGIGILYLGLVFGFVR